MDKALRDIKASFSRGGRDYQLKIAEFIRERGSHDTYVKHNLLLVLHPETPPSRRKSLLDECIRHEVQKQKVSLDTTFLLSTKR